MHFGKVFLAILLTGCGLVVGPALAQPTKAPVCISLRTIKGTDSKDGKTIKFTLRDGTTRVNHLKVPCNGLIFGGFSWVIRNDDEVCKNSQSMRALTTGEICELGKFDPPVKAPLTKN